MFSAELARRPEFGEFSEMILVPALWGAGQREKELDGELHRFEVAHVDDPEAVGAIVESEAHLLLNFRNRVGIDPFVGTRAADIVEVVVDSRAAGALAFFGCGKAAEVAPVVVGPEQCDVLGHAHASFVVALHLFVEGPDLRDFSDVGIDGLGKDLALVGDDFFEQLGVGLR